MKTEFPALRIEGETIGWKKRFGDAPISRHFPNSEIERYTSARASIIPYRILVGIDIITREAEEEKRLEERRAGKHHHDDGLAQHGLANVAKRGFPQVLGGVGEKEEWARKKQKQERKDAEVAKVHREQLWKKEEEEAREKAEREKAERKKAEEEAAAFQRTIGNLKQKADIAALVRGMRKYSIHCGIQEQGCGALWNLAVNADNQIKIAEQGGIDVTLEAMRTHRSHAGAQEAGCWALLNIGWSNQNLQKQIKNAGAEALVQGAMAASGATDVTKERGQQLLDRLRRV